MNRKKIIQICIIIGAFAASGVVLYNGFKSTAPPAPLPGNQASPGSGGASRPEVIGAKSTGAKIIDASKANIDKILPLGSKLDLTILGTDKRPNVVYDQLALPVLKCKKLGEDCPDVGVDEDQLITPAPLTAPSGGQPGR